MELVDALIYAQPAKIADTVRLPYDYLAAIPSNNGNVRTQFIHGFNDTYFGITDTDTITTINDIITVFHNSSLLIDDIEDGSEFRRGFPAAHTKYGVPLTLNCGNLMYFVALQTAQVKLPKLHPDTNKEQVALHILNVLVEELLHLHHGQGLDIHWRDHLRSCELPLVEQYMEMIMNKTGGLFRLAVRLLAVFLPQKHHQVVPIANLFGIVFQIRDDLLSLVDTKYSRMKGIQGEDLVEGKLSLPILHCLRESTEKSPVRTLLYEMNAAERRGQPQLVAEAVEYMRLHTHLVEYTQNLLRIYGAKIQELVGSDSDSFLVQMVDKLLSTI